LEELLDVTWTASEECLQLEVSTPLDPTNQDLSDAKLPVLFWVHGGGFTGGQNLHNDLARLGDAGDVIVVAVSYR